jgi:hypothetical protein
MVVLVALRRRRSPRLRSLYKALSVPRDGPSRGPTTCGFLISTLSLNRYVVGSGPKSKNKNKKSSLLVADKLRLN